MKPTTSLLLLTLLLAGCAAPQHNTDWHGISREVGRIVNTPPR